MAEELNNKRNQFYINGLINLLISQMGLNSAKKVLNAAIEAKLHNYHRSSSFVISLGRRGISDPIKELGLKHKKFTCSDDEMKMYDTYFSSDSSLSLDLALLHWIWRKAPRRDHKITNLSELDHEFSGLQREVRMKTARYDYICRRVNCIHQRVIISLLPVMSNIHCGIAINDYDDSDLVLPTDENRDGISLNSLDRDVSSRPRERDEIGLE
jgi:hypothetical protein